MHNQQSQSKSLMKDSVIHENPEINESFVKDSPLKSTILFESEILNDPPKILPMVERRTFNPPIAYHPFHLQISNRTPVNVHFNDLKQSRRYSVAEHKANIGQPITFNQLPTVPIFRRDEHVRMVPVIRKQPNDKYQYSATAKPNIQYPTTIGSNTQYLARTKPTIHVERRIKQEVEITAKQSKMCDCCGVEQNKQILVYKL